MPDMVADSYYCRGGYVVPITASVAATTPGWRGLGEGEITPQEVARWSLPHRPRRGELCKVYVYGDPRSGNIYVKVIYGDQIRDCAIDYVGPAQTCGVQR